MKHSHASTRLILWTAVACFNATTVVLAQVTMTDEEALRYVRPLWDGIDGIDANTRARVRASPTALKVYADVLSGDRVASFPFDTVVALWWLAESDEPAFVPIFLRYAEPNQSEFPRYAAIYGLARHAGRDDVRARLLALASDAPTGLRLRLADALMHINDDNARLILRGLRHDDLGPRTPAMIRQVLIAPARQTKGRFPCLRNERLVPGRGGAFECGAGPRGRP